MAVGDGEVLTFAICVMGCWAPLHPPPQSKPRGGSITPKQGSGYPGRPLWEGSPSSGTRSGEDPHMTPKSRTMDENRQKPMSKTSKLM